MLIPPERFRFQNAILFLSVLTFLATVPHAVEDFHYGVPQKFGVSASVAGLLLGIGYAVQVVGIIAVSRDKRWGLAVTLLVGLGWLLGALFDHLVDIFSSQPYREGLFSRVLVLLIIGLSAGVTLLSGLALKQRV
ncbi:MAG TPA: hypothetical protein VFG95_10355 [Nitrospiria bacterium]|nr:hypothetical protein [Nitrospiria bacterium]